MLISHQFPHIYSPISVFTLHKINTYWTVSPELQAKIKKLQLEPSVNNIFKPWGLKWVVEERDREGSRIPTRQTPWSISFWKINEQRRKTTVRLCHEIRTNVNCQKAEVNKWREKIYKNYNITINVICYSFNDFASSTNLERSAAG